MHPHLHSLLRRREPRAVGLYAVCAILVVLYALSVLYGIGAEAPPGGPQASDFVIPAAWLSLPVAVALIQLWRQTLLGWFVLLAAFGAGAITVCYVLVNDRELEPWPLIVLAILVTICVELMRRRPRRDEFV